MLIRSLQLLLTVASTAYGLKDALPFFLLSTESIDSSVLSSQQISSVASLESNLRKALESCSASQYIFVEQPGVRASDLSSSDSMPHLERRISSDVYKTVVQVPEVMGKIGLVQLEIDLEEKCGREKVTHRHLPLITEDKASKTRSQIIKAGDAILNANLNSILTNHTSHVLIYSSVPADEDAAELELLRYEMAMDEPPFQEHMHTDLKRDVPQVARKQASGDDDFQAGLPLFEKYQFLSPGIFMGLTVTLMLLLILYVGISAIAGLEVSYMAFSKEMGPQAQKKQQ